MKFCAIMTDYISEWCKEYGIRVTWDYGELPGFIMGECSRWNNLPDYNRIVINEKLRDWVGEQETQWHEFSHALAWQKDHETGHGDAFWKWYKVRYNMVDRIFWGIAQSIHVLLH